VVSKPHLRPNGCVADLFDGSSRLRRDCAFSIGLRLALEPEVLKPLLIILLSRPLQHCQPAQEKPDDELEPHLPDNELPKKPAQLTSLRTVLLPHCGQLIFFSSPTKTSCSKHSPQHSHSYYQSK